MGDDVGRIKDRLDVVDVIGDYVKLTRSGQNYKGLCPFHDEKTPSFHVSRERQSWHCFGCGKGGDIFTFVIEKEGLSFSEALEMLARRAGIELKALPSVREKRSLFDAMEAACSLYRKNLDGNQGVTARSYLTRRAVPESALDLFELGWAPLSWDFLIKELGKIGISLDEAIRCGLVLRGDKGAYDRFRGRVIFPIRDISGRLVAFGGRILDGEGAKYLNSPETELYSKRKTLYLIDKAKAAIRERGNAILVEGYMDAIRLHLEGFPQGVATLGTALTEEQAGIIKRLADRVYICYDSDLAGQSAAMRGMYLLQNSGLSVKVVSLSHGKDPDELLSSPGGRGEFEKCLRDALPLVDHHIRVILPDLEDGDGRKKALESLMDGLSSLETMDISPHLPKLSAIMGIRDFEVLDAIRDRKKRDRTVLPSRTAPRPTSPACTESEPEDPDIAEIAVAALLWQERSLRKNCDLCDILGFIDDDRIKFMVSSILSGESPDFLERRWLETGETFHLRTLAMGGAYLEEFTQPPEWKWNHFLGLLHRKKAQMRYNELRVKMLKGQASAEEIREHEEIRQVLVSHRDS